MRPLGYASECAARLTRSVLAPIRRISPDSSGLETRGLYSLACEKVLDGLAMYTKHPPDPHRVEPAVMDETTDRFRVDAELFRDLTDADQAWVPSAGRHDPNRVAGLSRLA